VEGNDVRLARVGSLGQEKPALVDDDMIIRDLSAIIVDWTPAAISTSGIQRVSAIDPRTLPIVPAPIRFGVPIKGVGKFLGIGMNYKDFAAAATRPLPTEPALFTKAISCLNGPDDDIVLPRASLQTDWEVELGVVIGRTAQYVERAEALTFVAGYTLVNDLSERSYQNDRGGTWDKGKGCDTFGPVGPWLVTADAVQDPQCIDLWLELNGERLQNGNTANMIFSVAEIIAHVSHFMTLEPGDILTTGTPAGVGFTFKPPRFLKAGDSMRLGSQILGTQQQMVREWKAT
jgi:2-keto-4-pentenoate hydratase/2-oxohepta-3-ene-1,7-dioic acid hydratase in catechol pathway